MKYFAAYFLCTLSGKAVDAAAVEKVLKEAGIKADADQVKKTVEAFAGKQIHELITEGKGKLASKAPAAGAPVAAAAKKEEKPVEEEVEVDADMGGMFGDDDGY
jgi:ribosomal protein L12E/L44/L45/RPP1/RPP2